MRSLPPTSPCLTEGPVLGDEEPKEIILCGDKPLHGSGTAGVKFPPLGPKQSPYHGPHNSIGTGKGQFVKKVSRETVFTSQLWLFRFLLMLYVPHKPGARWMETPGALKVSERGARQARLPRAPSVYGRHRSLLPFLTGQQVFIWPLLSSIG